MHSILHTLTLVLAVVITFGLAVFVHEFGHMMFALVRGVGVESFAIGMGPKITSWKWRGIDFSIRWLPLGGFVKLQGRTPPAAAAADKDASADAPGDQKNEKSLAESSYDDLYALQDKGVLTKVLVFGGGVFMNFVTACIGITLLLLIGQQEDRFSFVIEQVKPGTVEAKAGLRANDQVVAYNGAPVRYFEDFALKLDEDLDKIQPGLLERLAARLGRKPAAGEPTIHLTLGVRRAGTAQTLTFPPLNAPAAEDLLGSLLGDLKMPTRVGSLIPGFPAENAGVKIGDQILAVNGKPVDSYEQIAKIINARLGQTISLTIRRGEKTLILSMIPKEYVFDAKKGVIGFYPGSEYKEIYRVANPLKAIAMAPGEAWNRMVKYAILNVKFFKNASFKQVRENINGPIGIAAFTAEIAQRGPISLLDWFVTLNLLLLIFNLLPVPVLDGGFILLAVIEAVIRRPVPPRVLGPIYTAFMVFFIILIAAISLQDVWRWVPKLVH